MASKMFFWIPALGLSIADKHLILSSETLPGKIIKKLIDLIEPYSVQDHNYFIQEIRARSSPYLPCYTSHQESFYKF